MRSVRIERVEGKIIYSVDDGAAVCVEREECCGDYEMWERLWHKAKLLSERNMRNLQREGSESIGVFLREHGED